MIKLCGFAVSNYYNKVKLVLLEKGLAFDEELVYPSHDAALAARSPLGKVPFIETDQGCLSESQAIVEYLEDAYPAHPLYPSDPFERAKCREFIQHLELNVELIARRLYAESFFGGKVSDETKSEVRAMLDSGLQGLARLTRFSPYVLGADFTLADCAAWVHFGVISRATQAIYGADLVARHLPGVTAYMALMGSRSHVRTVADGREKAMAPFLAALATKKG